MVNPNSVIIFSTKYAFTMNPNGYKKGRYIIIVSKMRLFPAKGIFYDNQVRDASQFYDNKPRKLVGKKRLVTTDGIEIRMLISDGLDYLPVRCPNNEEMDSHPKTIISPDGEWKT